MREYATLSFVIALAVIALMLFTVIWLVDTFTADYCFRWPRESVTVYCDPDGVIQRMTTR